MGRKTPKGPKQRERARARHDSVFGSSPHILDAAERLFHQERATLRGAGMCRYEPETLQIAGAHLQAAWRNSFHAAENPFLQVLPRTPKIASSRRCCNRCRSLIVIAPGKAVWGRTSSPESEIALPSHHRARVPWICTNHPHAPSRPDRDRLRDRLVPAPLWNFLLRIGLEGGRFSSSP